MEFLIWMSAFTSACILQMLGFQSQREAFFKAYLLIIIFIVFSGIICSLLFFKEQIKNIVVEFLYYITKFLITLVISIIISKNLKMDFFSLFEIMSFIILLINNPFRNNINK